MKKKFSVSLEKFFIFQFHLNFLAKLRFILRFGMQYNGQTNDECRYRWNNYRDNNRKSLRGEDHKQAGFFAHFWTGGQSGFINDTEIIFIDNTDPSDTTRREEFGIDTLKTRHSQGLNNTDPYH